MDFNDTPEEAKYRAEAHAWLAANAEPKPKGGPGKYELGAEALTQDYVDAAKDWQRRKADAGWACLRWPKEYGGQDAASIQNVIWNQEEAKFDVPTGVFGITHGMCGPTVMAHGTPEQKAKWIPGMLRGDNVWCQLFSEPAAGSDLAGLRTTAVRDGDDWVINGQKIWTTGAQWSDWGILVVRSDPNAPKHAGLTYFVVDMHAPGVEVRPIHQINDAREFNEVFFTDVRIPDAYRLDDVGNGWKVALTTLMNERASIGGGGGGGALKDLIALAARIETDSGRAIDQTAVRERLADFLVRARGLKYTGFRTLTALSQGKLPGPEASLGKLVGAVLGQDMAAFALDLQNMGGAVAGETDALDGGAWQEQYLSFPGLRIAGGTDEVLRNIIAERVLGLPPEMRADKGIPFRDIPTGS
jgi:alkylation response protein AidB-like acyl-CoA dehydrogenase